MFLFNSFSRIEFKVTLHLSVTKFIINSGESPNCSLYL